MWRHDQNEWLRTLSAAHVNHAYYIYPTWTRTKNPKPLRRYVGISEISTTTRFIYIRRWEGHSLKKVLYQVVFHTFIGLIDSCTRLMHRENFDAYNGTWNWHVVMNLTCAQHAHYIDSAYGMEVTDKDTTSVWALRWTTIYEATVTQDWL